MIHQFGAISTARGVSLLVDVLEACRRRLTVTSCLAPTDLDTSRLRSPGPRMLADLLSFAAAGGVGSEDAGSREGTPDPLLVDLADRLWQIGLDVVADYGPPGGVHIPLAVGHPSVPGTLLVAVLTDTPEYVATGSLRTRDRYWVERLEKRGWSVVALSALDVFLDPQGAAEQILAKVARRVHEAGVPDDVASSAAPPRVLEVEAEVEEAEIVPVESEDASPRYGHRPDLFPGLAISAYSERELDRMTAWVMSDGVDRGVDEIVEVVQAELQLAADNPRVGAAIVASIDRLRTPPEPETAPVEPDPEPSPRTAAEIVRERERVLPDRAWEDDDRAWNDRERDDDERILRERPPHWE